MSFFGSDSDAAAAGDFPQARARMVEEIAAMARSTAALTGREQFAPAVMAAMGKVPRHLFVPPDEVGWAYRNHPLPIGSGQTISQPYIVALSTELVQPRSHHRVLEVGTGSGYQAAVLAELVREVYSVEIIDSLAREAEARLRQLGYANVRVRRSDGHAGWPEAAPFDGIVVTAAAARVPAALVDQLRPGGRMVIPVGEQGRSQDLVLVEKIADGRVEERRILSVMFVPMTGG
jgi:protein-L-isoaspartate(D-aspartate) O-methyltransferase